MKKKLTLRKICLFGFLLFILLGILWYAIAREQFWYRVNVTDTLSPSGNVGELIAGDMVEQSFSIENESLERIALLFQTYGRTNTGSLDLSIYDGEQLLYETSLDVSTLEDNTYTSISPALTGVAGKTLTLRVSSKDGVSGNAVTLATGENVNTGRVSVAVDGLVAARKDGAGLNGSMCLELTTRQVLWFGQYYWLLFAIATVLLAGYLLHLLQCEKQGKSCVGLRFLDALSRYQFLLQQLVSRDFKTKYKRSMLGVFWSFLNPLLTMVVQYVVFSTLFKTDIPNYPVYLLSGIICFNYFNEAVNQCMISITGNASLITKVYVPKYIYPLSKAISSGINLLLSLLPLLMVILITGLRLHAAVFLLLFALACLFAFSLGMGMLLATSMVFFRDTQFLWGVVSMLWMYGTPVFYPESIIPARFMTLYKMNPLYHIIRVFRTVLIDGVSPEPKAYLLCLIACLIPLLLGVLVFKKNQDHFILYV